MRVGVVVAGIVLLGWGALGAWWCGAAPGRAKPARRAERAAELGPGALPAQELGAGDRAPEPAALTMSIETDESRRRPAAEAARIRGLLLDKRTGQPIAQGVGLRLATTHYEERVAPGGDGAFESQRAFPRLPVRLEVIEARSGDVLFSRRLPFEPAESQWTIRLDIGLLVPLELAPEWRVSRARLLEGSSGAGRPWAWREVLGGAHPYLHYERLPREPEPGAEARVEVRGRFTGAWEEYTGSARIALARGILPPARVAFAEPCAVRGRVVDASGRALESVVARLQPLAPALFERARERAVPDWERFSAWTASDGWFQFDALEAGPYRLHVSTGLGFVTTPRIEIEAGLNDLGTFTLGGGVIRGELVAASGEQGDPAALFSLQDLATGKTWVEFSETLPLSGTSAFAFEHVPSGSYELLPRGLPGARFEPASSIVSPPAEDLVFRLVAGPSLSLVIHARAAESGEALAEFTVVGRLDRTWVARRISAGERLPFESERWIASADGRQALLLDAQAFRPERWQGRERWKGPERFVEGRAAEALLRRGWSLPVLCSAVEQSVDAGVGELGAFCSEPLAGVNVLADGEFVARSEEDGLALVSLEREPGRLDFELPGWRCVFSSLEDGIRRVWMARE